MAIGGTTDATFGYIAWTIFLTISVAVGSFFLGEFERYRLRADVVRVTEGAAALANSPQVTSRMGGRLFAMGWEGAIDSPSTNTPSTREFRRSREALIENAMPERMVEDGILWVGSHRSVLTNGRAWAEIQMRTEPQEIGILPMREYWVLAVGATETLSERDCLEIAGLNFPGLKGVQVVNGDRYQSRSPAFVPSATSDLYNTGVLPGNGAFPPPVPLLRGHRPRSERMVPVSSYVDNGCTPGTQQVFTWNAQGAHRNADGTDRGCVGALRDRETQLELACEGGGGTVFLAFRGNPA